MCSDFLKKCIGYLHDKNNAKLDCISNFEVGKFLINHYKAIQQELDVPSQDLTNLKNELEDVAQNIITNLKWRFGVDDDNYDIRNFLMRYMEYTLLIQENRLKPGDEFEIDSTYSEINAKFRVEANKPFPVWIEAQKAYSIDTYSYEIMWVEWETIEYLAQAYAAARILTNDIEILFLHTGQPNHEDNNMDYPEPPDQDFDYKSSEWYGGLSQGKKDEIDNILKNQPGFKPYMTDLYLKDYFSLDDNGNPILDNDPTNGKIPNSDLKRLIKKLTPMNIQGKFKAWENFFNTEYIKNVSDIETSQKFTKILDDLGIE